MTTAEVVARNNYVGNGSASAFAYTFEISNKNDIEVMINGVAKTVDIDFSVTNVGIDGGGLVTHLAVGVATPPLTGDIINYSRKQGLGQLSVYTPNEAVPSARIALDLDKIYMALQMFKEFFNRTLMFKKQSTLVGPVMADGVVGRILRWKTTTELENIDPTTTFSPGVLTIPLSIANGGTNAATAKLARASIGAIPVVNVKTDFGAVGDGVADDSTAFANAIAAMPSSGGTIIIPVGTYRFTAAGLSIIDNTASGNHRGIHLVGDCSGGSGGSLNTVLEYNLSSTVDFVSLLARDCIFENLVFRVVSGKTADAILNIDNPTGAGAGIATNNLFINCRFVKDTGSATNCVRISRVATSNVEYMRFVRCYFDTSGASTTCVYIDNNANSKLHRFTQCSFNSATYGIQQIRGSFTANECTFGSLTGAAILLTNSNDYISIINCDEESCARFLDTRGIGGAGSSNAFWPILIQGGRMSANSLHADGLYIAMTFGGPLTMINCQIGGGAYISTFKLRLNCSVPGVRFAIIGCSFPTDSIFQAGTIYNGVLLGNRGQDSGSLMVIIPDQIQAVGINDVIANVGRNLLVDRIKATGGDALVAGDFALSAGFGTTASVGTITGTDTRCRFTVTSAGTGQGANPTITLTFKDGTFTTAPFAVVARTGGNQAAVLPTWTTTATTLVITFPGTPVAAETYTFQVMVIG